jgi:Fe-S oxidoreductase
MKQPVPQKNEELQNSQLQEQPKKITKQKRQYPFFAIEDPVEENRIPIFLKTFESVLKDEKYRLLLDLYLNTCASCNSCAEQCHLYQTTHEQRDLPAYRSNLLRSIYKRYYTTSGKLLGKLVGAIKLEESDIDNMIESFYRCTMCRRCAVECPMGVDNALITRIGRCILGELNLAPKNFTISSSQQLRGIGNTSGIPKAAFLDTLDFLQEEIKDITGQNVEFPRDKVGAEYLFISPVSDYIMEADTLMGTAMALQAAGADWTIGTEYYDAINYGLFYSDKVTADVLNKLLAEAYRLKVKKILIGECGHATKVVKLFMNIFGKYKFEVQNVMEYTAKAIEEGRLKINPEVNKDTVTYHDPCNLGRGLGIYDAPRTIVKASTIHFVEMYPNREKNYCCGGGGGGVTVPDIYEFRMRISGIKKVEQVKATGAKYLIAPCANCKKQLRELMEYHKLPVNVIGVHDLLIKALVF